MLRPLLWIPLCLAVATRVAADPVCFEAEAGAPPVAPARVGSDADPASTMPAAPGASGGRYLEIPQGAGNPPAVTTGSATYRFRIATPGQYQLWCRTWWFDECGNSIGVQIDDKPAFTIGQDGTYKSWHWIKVVQKLRQLDLAAGDHTLTLQNREDGVRIDQILLTQDRRFVPVDIEPVSAP